MTPRLSFIDIFEDGNLDLMYHAQMTDSSGYRTVIIQPVYNNIDYDAFFLSILLLSSQNTNTLMMNTEYIGGVASLYVTLLSGEFAAKTGNQLSQAGRTLQLPNIRLGLGRTNNYIEQLHATLPRKVNFNLSRPILNSYGVQLSQTHKFSLCLRHSQIQHQNGL